MSLSVAAMRIVRGTLLALGLVLVVPGLVSLGISIVLTIVAAVTGNGIAALYLLVVFALPGAAVTAAGIGLVRFGAGPETSSTDREGEDR